MVHEGNGFVMGQVQLLLNGHEALAHFHSFQEVLQGIHGAHVAKGIDEGFLGESEMTALDQEKNKTHERELGAQVVLENLIERVTGRRWKMSSSMRFSILWWRRNS